MFDSDVDPHEGITVLPDTAGGASGEEGLASVLEIASLVYRRVSEALDRVGLSYHDHEVLSHVRETPRVTLAELEVVVRIPGAEASGVVAELAQRGWVRVMTDGGRGAPTVELTPLGASRAADARAQLDAVGTEFAAHFRAEERVALRRLLDKVGS